MTFGERPEQTRDRRARQRMRFADEEFINDPVTALRVSEIAAKQGRPTDLGARLLDISQKLAPPAAPRLLRPGTPALGGPPTRLQLSRPGMLARPPRYPDPAVAPPTPRPPSPPEQIAQGQRDRYAAMLRGRLQQEAGVQSLLTPAGRQQLQTVMEQRARPETRGGLTSASWREHAAFFQPRAPLTFKDAQRQGLRIQDLTARQRIDLGLEADPEALRRANLAFEQGGGVLGAAARVAFTPLAPETGVPILDPILRELTSPAGLAATLIPPLAGARAAAGLRTAAGALAGRGTAGRAVSLVPRGAAAAIEPFSRGPLAQRLALEALPIAGLGVGEELVGGAGGALGGALVGGLVAGNFGPIARTALRGARAVPEAAARAATIEMAPGGLFGPKRPPDIQPRVGPEQPGARPQEVDDPITGARTVEDHIRQADPDPQPPRPPGDLPPDPPRGPGRPRGPRGGRQEGPEDVLARIQRQRTPDEKPDETLLRRHAGAVTAAENDARIIVEDGAKMLRASGIGQTVRGRLAARPEDIEALDALNAALHSGSIDLAPESLRPAYERLRSLYDWEEGFRIDFDPEMAAVEHYIYRGWKPPESFVRAETGRGQVGATPTFRKPRVGATYQEMREAGFEPLFWNPFEQFRVARMQGVRYRQQMQIIDDLKRLEQARPHPGGATPEGWRTPRIGPAFEGKPFAVNAKTGEVLEGASAAQQATKPQVMYTRRWIVPDGLVDRLENMYGVPALHVKAFGGRVDVQKAIDTAVFVPKRAKLIFSLFQQQDFLARSGIGAWAGATDALLAGHPIAAAQRLAHWPQSAAEIIQANLRPGVRAQIRRTLNSTAPLLPDRPGVHFRGIQEAGLSTIDVTILPEDIDRIIRVVADEAKLSPKRVSRVLGDVEGMMRRGLFEGVYPAAQMTDIRHNIAPMLARQFPEATDEALNGMIARVTNIKYSTIPAWQSVFQHRPLREFLRRVFFSIGESEGLLRQATRAIPIRPRVSRVKGVPIVRPGLRASGTETRFWVTHWVGAYMFLIATANAIHFASTGQPLPLDRYTPISNDNWGPLPFGYNRDFASPDIPLTGRNATDLTLDIVGQIDTVFRVLDPLNFLTSRESVPVRALSNQVFGEDFYGRPIDTVGPGGVISRTQQLINDLFSPIGIGSGAQEILRQTTPLSAVIPEQEGRVGIAGSAFQATGLNVRAEPTLNLLDRAAQEQFGKPFDDLEPHERRQLEEAGGRIQEELAARTATAAIRGSEGAIRALRVDEVRVDLMAEQQADDGLFDDGSISGEMWRDRRQIRLATLRGRMDEIYAGVEIGEPENPAEKFYQFIQQYTDGAGQVDWDRVDREVSALSLEDQAFIDRNTGLGGTKVEQRYRRVTRDLDDSGWFDLKDETAWQAFKRVHSDRLGDLPDSFFEWKNAEIATEAATAIREGADPRLAYQETRETVNNYNMTQAFDDFFRTEFRHEWVVDHPELARDAISFGYFNPDVKEEEFFKGTRQPVAVR